MRYLLVLVLLTGCAGEKKPGKPVQLVPDEYVIFCIENACYDLDGNLQP